MSAGPLPSPAIARASIGLRKRSTAGLRLLCLVVAMAALLLVVVHARRGAVSDRINNPEVDGAPRPAEKLLGFEYWLVRSRLASTAGTPGGADGDRRDGDRVAGPHHESVGVCGDLSRMSVAVSRCQKPMILKAFTHETDNRARTPSASGRDGRTAIQERTLR